MSGDTAISTCPVCTESLDIGGKLFKNAVGKVFYTKFINTFLQHGNFTFSGPTLKVECEICSDEETLSIYLNRTSDCTRAKLMDIDLKILSENGYIHDKNCTYPSLFLGILQLECNPEVQIL